MLMLSSVLVNETALLHVRNAAGLAMKNALTARVRPIVHRFHTALHRAFCRILRDKPNMQIDGFNSMSSQRQR